MNLMSIDVPSLHFNEWLQAIRARWRDGDAHLDGDAHNAALPRFRNTTDVMSSMFGALPQRRRAHRLCCVQ